MNVARVEMIQHVVKSDSRAELNAMPMEFEVNRILQFCVQCEKRWEAPRLILRADVVPVLIEAGKWKSRMHIQDRYEIEFIWEPDHIPK